MTFIIFCWLHLCLFSIFYGVPTAKFIISTLFGQKWKNNKTLVKGLRYYLGFLWVNAISSHIDILARSILDSILMRNYNKINMAFLL